MSRIPRVSEAEWDVLSVLWRESPLTAAQVFARLASRAWKLNTVRTFLARLEKKGAVAASSEGKEGKLYAPAVQREECVRAASETFLERVFEGATGSLLLHFVRSKQLSQMELAELQAILQEQPAEPKKGLRK